MCAEVGAVSASVVAGGRVSLGGSVAASVCMVVRSAFSGVWLKIRPMATPPITTAALMAPINIFLFVSIMIPPLYPRAGPGLNSLYLIFMDVV